MGADGPALSERPTSGVCADGHLSVASCLHPPLILFLSTPHSAPLAGPSARGECAPPGQWALGECLATQSTGLLPTAMTAWSCSTPGNGFLPPHPHEAFPLLQPTQSSLLPEILLPPWV